MSHIDEVKSYISGIKEEDISIFETGGIIFDDNRKNIIKSQGTADFQAVPGSGKTTLLVSKLLLIANKWNFSNRGICVLSHTNVAKDEIHKKIRESSIGTNLLKYPHFIGTIQGFVDKFLGELCLRYLKLRIHRLDDRININKWNQINTCDLTDDFKSLLGVRLHKTSYQVDYFLNKLNKLKSSDFEFRFKNGSLHMNYWDIFKDDVKENYQKIIIKERIDRGVYSYNEMYNFANYLITQIPQLVENIRSRFPLVFIDEAQDNNKTQDEILEKLFNHDNCIYQRFGDQDQAIYDFDGNDSENSFYSRPSNININDSKRFSQSHISYITPFKLSDIELTATGAEPKDLPKIIFYNNENISQIIPTFLSFIDDNFTRQDNPIVKIIGFVGKAIEDPEREKRISSYVNNFKKDRKKMIFEYLIQVLHFSKDNLINTNECFYSIIEFIVKNYEIKFNGETLSMKNKNNIREYLKQIDPDNTFRKTLSFLFKNDITPQIWEEKAEIIRGLFNISPNKAGLIKEFIAKEGCICATSDNAEEEGVFLQCNDKNCLYTPVNNIEVQIDTIHGVKGETHDATLVIETKSGKAGNDISYCLKDDLETPSRVKFKKQLYVATSRARSFLCIAIEDTDINKEKLKTLGLLT